MHLHFLGAATTVTGSQFLLTTDRARVLIDCGMFQGSPNESIRNRIPLAYDPAELDAILLTHAHLDHCGLIPHVVKDGFRGPIWATDGTIELARLVLLDSGKLQEEFAKRGLRWERRHPDEAAAEDRRDWAAYEAAIELAERGEAGARPQPRPRPRPSRRRRRPGQRGHRRARPDDDRAERAGHGRTGRAGVERRVAQDPRRDAGALRPAPVRRRADDPPGGRRSGRSRRGAVDVRVADRPRPPRRPARRSRSRPTRRSRSARSRPKIDVDLDEPLYDEADARRVARALPAGLDYDRRSRSRPGSTRRSSTPATSSARRSSGCGSSIARAGRSDGIVFSGDLGRTGTPILRDPTIVTDADYVLVESTYGGREHEPQAEAVRILAETVRLVAEHDGVLLVPSFAIGRTQEVVWELDRLISAGEIPLLPLYLDSPMASKASDIYRAHPDYYDEETRDLLAPARVAARLPEPDRHERRPPVARRSRGAKRPYMIVASNGMLTGGRVVGHLRNLIDDPSAVLLFVGYQGEGTLGAHLQAGAKTVRIDGQQREVRCQVRSISGFSAHADESELLAWLANFARGKRPGDPGFPRRVFLVHGDPDAQAALLPRVRALGFEAEIPVWHQEVELE